MARFVVILLERRNSLDLRFVEGCLGWSGKIWRGVRLLELLEIALTVRARGCGGGEPDGGGEEGGLDE